MTEEGFAVTISPTTLEHGPLKKKLVANALSSLLGSAVVNTERVPIPSMTAVFLPPEIQASRDPLAVCVHLADEDAAVRAADLEFKLEEVLGQPVRIEAHQKQLSTKEREKQLEGQVLHGEADVSVLREIRKKRQREEFLEKFVEDVERKEAKKPRAEHESAFRERLQKKSEQDVMFEPTRSVCVVGCPVRFADEKYAIAALSRAVLGMEIPETTAKALEGVSVPVVDTCVARNDTSGTFKGVVFAQFVSEAFAQKAVKEVRTIKVGGSVARIKPFHPELLPTDASMAKKKPVIATKISRGTL